MGSSEKIRTIYNPSGFIEQHFIGVQTPQPVLDAVDELVKRAAKLKSQNKPALVLVDVTKVPKIDVSDRMLKARRSAVKAMREAKYDRVAIYGALPVQVMVNTLVLIAGKRDKIRVFASRDEALKWLKSED